MKAVILAGGMGIRLRPFTFSIPKPLMPIGETPILEIIVKRLRKFGFRDFVLAIGYKSKMIETYFRGGEELGVSIDYLIEKKPLGTAGFLSEFKNKFRIGKNESFLIMNGDILTKLNFSKMIEYHRQNGFEITVGIKRTVEQESYGAVRVENGLVSGIVEKPVVPHVKNTGIYIIKASAIKDVPENRFFTMPNLINKLISQNRRIGAYHIKEEWMGLEDLRHFEDIHNNKKAWRSILKD